VIQLRFTRKWALTGLIVGSMLAGGAVGATVFGAAARNAATTNTPAATTTRSGTFVPNEDPAHEAGESAEREAQEDTGQVPTVP
jgi:hypothetical protein